MSKAIAIGLTGLLGTAATSTTGWYFRSYETIWDQVKDDAIPSNKSSSDTLWQELKSKRTSKNTFKSEELKKILSNSESSSNENDLKNWCITSYSSTYKNIFKSPNEDLLSDVKEACILTIKEKLTSPLNEEDETDKEKFKKNLSSLKDYPNTNSEPKLNPSLKEIQDLEKKESKPEDNWKKLRDWCKKIYKKGFQGEETHRWKLAEKFCKSQ